MPASRSMSSLCNESRARIDSSCCRAGTRSVAQCRLCWVKSSVQDTVSLSLVKLQEGVSAIAGKQSVATWPLLAYSHNGPVLQSSRSSPEQREIS